MLDFLILKGALIWSTLSKGEDTAATVCLSANGKMIWGFMSSYKIVQLAVMSWL